MKLIYNSEAIYTVTNAKVSNNRMISDLLYRFCHDDRQYVLGRSLRLVSLIMCSQHYYYCHHL